jgi:hypothetical protein
MYNVDKDFRETERIVHNNWTTTVKRKDWEVAQALNHQTKLFLKPKYDSYVPEWSVEIMETLLNERGHTRPEHLNLWTWINERRGKWDTLWGLMLWDLHLDQLDSKNSSFKSRVKMANERISRVLERVMKFDPDELLIANLWDTFDSDWRDKTSSGKHVMQKTISEKDAFKLIMERTINTLDQIKALWIPIEYKVISGNHDELTAQHYWTALEYYYHWDIKVTTHENRAYVQRGKTLIALGHWDTESHKNMLQLTTDEFLLKTAKKIEKMYAYLGHNHRSIISQDWPLMIKTLQAPNVRSRFTEKYWYDMVQWMHWFVWWKNEWEIAEVRG